MSSASSATETKPGSYLSPVGPCDFSGKSEACFIAVPLTLDAACERPKRQHVPTTIFASACLRPVGAYVGQEPFKPWEMMTRRTGSADLPLHGGRVPAWLGQRMASL